MRSSGRHTARLRLGMTVPAVAGIVAVAAIGWATLQRTCAAHGDVAGQAAARAASETFRELIRESTEELSATLGSLAADRELTAALAARDPHRLLAAAGPTFHDLRLRDGISHWNYWEPEAGTGGRGLRNVVRLAAPTLRGDVDDRALLARAAREHAVVSGIELGATAFALRVVAPVRDGDRIVGYAELGRDVATLLAELRRRTGDDAVLALDRRRIDLRGGASARVERDDGEDLPAVVVGRSPTTGAPELPITVAPGDLPDGGAALGVHRDGPRSFVRGAFPIRDAAGVKVGAIFVIRDVSDLAALEQALRRRALGAFALGVAVVGVAIVGAQEWIVVRPRRRRPVSADSGPGAPPAA